MTLPTGFPYPLNQEVQIPLEQVIPNPNQPRQFEHPEEIQLLAASMKAKGQEVAARVRPLTEAERAAHPGAWVMLIGGHGRREAALLNQFKTLKCTIEDITPEEAISAAARDNNIRDMHWWEWYLVIEQVDKASQKTQRDIANELGQTQTRVNWALKITKTLNPAARTLVKENLQKTLKNDDYDVITKNKGFSITERTLLTLAGLEDPNQVQQALQVVLDDYLTADQTKALVAWVQAGNPADSFNPKVVKPTPKPQALKPVHATPTAEAEPVTETPTPAHSASHTTNHPPKAALAQAPKSAATHGSEMGSAETALYEAVAGVSVVAKIRSKIKKGERPNLFEVFLLAGYNLWRGLVWLVKNSFRLTKQAVKWTFKAVKMTWKLLRESLEIVGLYKYVRAVFVLGFVITLLFGGWYIHTHGTGAVVHLVYSKLFSASISTPAPAPIAPTPQSTVQSVEAIPTAVTTVPTAMSQTVPEPHHQKMAAITAADSSSQGTLTSTPESAQPNRRSQLVASTQVPTTVPKKNGDMLTQAAGAAPGVVQAANGIKSLFGL